MEPTHFEALYPDSARSEEIAKVLSLVKQGKSVQVVGAASAGRSNLLGLLSYNKVVREKYLGENSKWFHFVPCNFSEIRKRPLFDATKFLFLNLVESLRERKMEAEHTRVQKMFKDSLDMHDELVLFQGLKQAVDYLAIEKELTIVYLFDRFEEYVPMITPEFFGNLRVLRNRAKYRFSVVFSLHRPLEDILEPALYADFAEFVAGNIVYLPLLDKPGLEFRIAYLEKITGKTIDKKTLEEITKLTGGHGKLTRLAAENVINNPVILNLPAGRQGSIQDLIKIPDQDTTGLHSLYQVRNDKYTDFLLSQPSIKTALEEIWHALTPAEQTFIETVILGSETTPESAKDDSMKYLENIDLVKDGRLTIPLLETFIASQTPLTQTSEHIVYDETTNDIHKGSLSLSEKLTAAEYKLLRFLLIHPEQVIERDEIITAVWKESASTAGVTDQAVDQLVFRLRRKIEDDLTHPVHIQTIKGRGIKFTP